MSKVTEAVLRQIAAFGPITIRDLDALDELAKVLPESGAKPAVNSLATHHLVDSERVHSRGTLYSISSAGRRALSALEAVPADAPVAQPRRSSGTGTYGGEELRPYTGRPGAMAAYAVPSLHNGERIERGRPILLATPVTR